VSPAALRSGLAHRIRDVWQYRQPRPPGLYRGWACGEHGQPAGRVAKESGETAICSEAFASALPATFTRPIGRFDLKGLGEQYNVVAVATE
jgi:hypothetical protein